MHSLSLMGKTVILNSLVGSLFVYKMQVSRTISKDLVTKFEKIVNDFLWGVNKRAKIKISTLYNDKTEGGLRIVNLHAKDDSLKIKWVTNCINDEKIQGLALEFLPDIGIDFWKCNASPKDAGMLVRQSFWRDVAQAWARYNFHAPRDKEEVLVEVLWYNSHIRIGGTGFFAGPAYRAGILTVGDLLDQDFKFCNLLQIASRFGNVLTQMQLNSIISAIPREWKEMLKDNLIETGFRTNFEKNS